MIGPIECPCAKAAYLSLSKNYVKAVDVLRDVWLQEACQLPIEGVSCDEDGPYSTAAGDARHNAEQALEWLLEEVYGIVWGLLEPQIGVVFADAAADVHKAALVTEARKALEDVADDVLSDWRDRQSWAHVS